MKKISLVLLSLLLMAVFSTGYTLAVSEGAADAKKNGSIDALFDDALEDVHSIMAAAQPKAPLTEIVLVPAAEGKEEGELIDLEFNQANLEDIIRVIAEAGGRNIVLDPVLKGRKMDLHLKKVNISEALQLIYNAHGLSSYSIGSILFISTEERIKKGTTKTKVIELSNLAVDDAKALVNNLVNVVNLSKEINTMVLVGAAEDVDKAEKIITKLDVPQPQVLLEAKVIEINDDYLRQLGVDWSDSVSSIIQESKAPYTLGTATVLEGGNVLRLHNLARSALQFNSTLHMLETENKAKVLSSPRVTTINNKEAQIFIGDKIPYTITSVTGGAASTEVRFVEPGIRLRITPSILEDDFVVIKIEPEVSYIYSWRGTGDQYPWVKSREATAYVRVRNGEPFVMGGLLSQEDKDNLYRVPFLGKVPLLGNLFSYEKKIDYNTDLIITVTPTIISDIGK